MPAIVVEYNKIVDKNGNNYRKPVKKPGTEIGLVVIVPEKVLQTLKTIPLGKKRVEYFNSDKFTDLVEKYFYVYYNYSKKKVYMIPDIYDRFNELLNALFTGFPQTCQICVEINLRDKNFKEILKQFTGHGFGNPKIEGEILVLSRVNRPSSFNNCDTTLHLIVDMLEQSKKDTCGINAQFSKTAIKFLRRASKIGFTVDRNGKKSQKELTGELVVEKVVQKDGKYIYIININEGSVGSGSEEEVDVSPTRYNFHSHPEEAYVRHSVDKAWPSLTDYLGYKILGNRTIFHCVATLEGVYVMSFGNYWVNHLNKISTNFIERNYNIDHKERYTPTQYTEVVNNIKYKGYPIYNVQFIPWENIEGKIFTVNYAKSGDLCISK